MGAEASQGIATFDKNVRVGHGVVDAEADALVRKLVEQMLEARKLIAK